MIYNMNVYMPPTTQVNIQWKGASGKATVLWTIALERRRMRACSGTCLVTACGKAIRQDDAPYSAYNTQLYFCVLNDAEHDIQVISIVTYMFNDVTSMNYTSTANMYTYTPII